MQSFKNVYRKRYYTLLVLPIALSILPLSAHAGCSREDIDHYIEKGFTPSQITSICGASVAPVAPIVQQTPEYQQQPVSQSPRSSTTQYVPVVQQQEPNRNFLIDSISGYDTVLTSDTLSYTVKKCYDVGEEDLFGFSPEVCPEIRYTLNLNGMKVVDTGRKYYLFGPPMIVLNGQVRRDIITDLKGVNSEQKETLRKQINTGNEVVLPIQQGIPMERVQTELHKILR